MNVSSVSQNPYEPPRSTIDQVAGEVILPSEIPIWNVNWDRALIAINAAICIVAAPCALVVMDSIVASGLAISAAGIGLTIREIVCRRRKRPAWTLNLVLGCAGPIVSMAIFSVIAINQWSPQAAKQNHMDWMVVALAILFVIVAIVGLLTVPKDHRR